MSRVAAALFTILGVSILLPVGGSEVRAAGGFCYYNDRHFVGAQFDPSFNVHGAKADIQVRNARLCGPNPPYSTFSHASAWSMLTDDTVGGGRAQIGYTHDTRLNPNLQFFLEKSRTGANHYTRFFGSPSLGDEHEFKVSRGLNDGRIRMYICQPDNGQNCQLHFTTDFDPLDYWTGIHAQFFGETVDQQSDMPGSTNKRAEFSRIREKDPSGHLGSVPTDSGWPRLLRVSHQLAEHVRSLRDLD